VTQERTDGQVVREILDGRSDSYGILVERYQDVLYRHAVRMTRTPDDAADIVQRALVKGFRRLRDCREPDRVGGWLFRITSNLCKDYLKDRRRDEVGLDDAPALVASRGNPETELDRTELGLVLERALARLSEDQREAFLLKHVEDRSYEEMSELLEVSVSALKMRVHRAREQLRDLLSEYES
jgi:RNA polymerase sigma-70 factor (ECF subfamily)